MPQWSMTVHSNGIDSGLWKAGFLTETDYFSNIRHEKSIREIEIYWNELFISILLCSISTWFVSFQVVTLAFRSTKLGTLFLGSMGMDFIFNPEFGLTQSHFYRNGGIKEFLVSPFLGTVRLACPIRWFPGKNYHRSVIPSMVKIPLV